jgi:outer membrane protein TolC
MTLKLSLASLITVAAFVLAGCGWSETAPFDPRKLEQIQREQAAGDWPHEMAPLPKTLAPAYDAEGNPTSRPYVKSTTQPLGPEVRMTLQEVIHRTVINNLEVRVAGFQPAIDKLRILEAEAKFDPTFFSNGQAQKTFPQSRIGGGDLAPTSLLSQNLEMGLKQPLTTGGQIELKQQFQRNGEGVQSGLFANPTTRPAFYDNNLVLQLTQPLLQNFGTATNLARIKIARNDQKISQLDFRDKLETSLAKVEEAYWRLVLAQRDVQIQEALLRNTEAERDFLIRRMQKDIGALPVRQAVASVLQRAATLVSARQRVGDVSDQVKQLMNDPDHPVFGPDVIIPADDPVEVPLQYTLSDLMETALQNRFELAQQKFRIDSAQTVIGAAKNNTLPKFDVVIQAGIEGLGDDFNKALRSQGNTDFITYQFGFQFEIPIGYREAWAIYQRTMLQHTQAIWEYRKIANDVGTDIKIAHRDLKKSWERIGITRAARQAAEKTLETIDVQEKIGSVPLTANFVQLKLQLQQDLAQAQSQENQALVDYNVAISKLEKAKGTLLRYNNVVMKEEKGPMSAKMARPEAKK